MVYTSLAVYSLALIYIVRENANRRKRHLAMEICIVLSLLLFIG